MIEQKTFIHNSTKKLLFVLLIALLTLPLFQYFFCVFKEADLFGVPTATQELPKISLQSWLKGNYQFEQAFDKNTGFKKSFIRLQNQLSYTLFNTSQAQSVVVGENGFLYGTSYIDGYTGGDFVGREKISVHVEKMKIVEQALEKKNIKLLCVFAPGKGSFFPEYIPHHYLTKVNFDSTNYSCYAKAFRDEGFLFVDLRKYCLSIKDTLQNPLFSQVGVHWGDYAAFIAIDIIAKKIEEITKIKMRKFQISKIEYLDTISETDRDIENVMNLFSSLPSYKMPHLTINYLGDAPTRKPNVLVVGDSYYRTISKLQIPDSIFEKSNYWLYNTHVPSDKSSPVFDLKKEIESRDVILLMGTDATLSVFPYTFIDNVCELYSQKNKDYYNLKKKEFRLFVHEVLKNIEKSNSWKAQLILKAEDDGVSKEDGFLNAAVWLYREKEKKNKTFVYNTQ